MGTRTILSDVLGCFDANNKLFEKEWETRMAVVKRILEVVISEMKKGPLNRELTQTELFFDGSLCRESLKTLHLFLPCSHWDVGFKFAIKTAPAFTEIQYHATNCR
jgi:hypothetical protein